MKSHTIEGFHNGFEAKAAIADFAWTLNRGLCLAAKGFAAFVPALAIVIGAAWAITVPGLEQFLQAALWASGFVFLALAIDSEKPTVGLPLATGLVIPVLALLSAHVASDFAIVAAFLIAVWVAASILRR